MIGKKAVIIGCGMAGLAAAGALANFFEKVIIVERDQLTNGSRPRDGVPQGRHAHGLLSAGQKSLEKIFPAFEERLSQAGAIPLRIGMDVLIERAHIQRFPKRDLNIKSYYMSRPLLEQVVRTEVERLPNVSIIEGSEVVAVSNSGNGMICDGVQFRDTGGTIQSMATSLVVDASGKGKFFRKFLRKDEIKLNTSRIEVNISYASMILDNIDDFISEDWKAIMTLPDAPSDKCRAVIFPIEGGRHLLTLGGMHGVRAPRARTEVLDHLSNLHTKTIFNALKSKIESEDIATFGFAASEWSHFERLKSLPMGIIPIGDAICRFNPVYGQGMSVAAIEACVLGEILRQLNDTGKSLQSLPQLFLAKAAKIIEDPWGMVAELDFIWPETRGDRPTYLALQSRGAALTRLALRDHDVHKLLTNVQHLICSRSELNNIL